jgi:hypothetical protein
VPTAIAAIALPTTTTLPEEVAVLAAPAPSIVVPTPLVVPPRVTAVRLPAKAQSRTAHPAETERPAPASLAIRSGAHGGLSGPGF